MKYMILVLMLLISACGVNKEDTVPSATPNEVPSGTFESDEDGVVVKGRAEVFVSSDTNGKLSYVSSGSSVVTYTNAAATAFAINVGSLTPGTFTGDTLSLGSITLSSLDDNHLKVCGVGNNQKCLKAIIRAYNSGSVAGFVHQVDNYGAPVYITGLNPSVALGLGSANSVQTQTYTIPSNVNRVRLTHFPSPTYAVSSDFSNAGDGAFSMTLVLEYALSL